MWQVLYPDMYVEPTINSFGSYVEPVGFVDSSQSSENTPRPPFCIVILTFLGIDLYPFHSDNGTMFYTSDMARSTRRFGYTYPEIVDWASNGTDLAATVRSRVNALYNPYAGSTTTKRKIKLISSRAANIGQAFGGVTFELAKELGVNNLDVQWTINVQIMKFAHPTTFVIDFFIGDPPPNPDTWSTAPNLIGSHAQFIAGNTAMIQPDVDPDGLIHGEVSMTHTIAAGVARGFLVDMTPSSVVPLLAQHLNWRARADDYCEIDVSTLAGLSIAVGSRRVQQSNSIYEFPLYSDTEYHVEATQGKAGGARGWHRDRHI